MKTYDNRHGLSLAGKTGLAAFLLALLAGAITPLAAVVPLTVFLLVCLLAPFLPRFSFFLPLISKGKPEGNRIALTFDDGPTPSTTPVLLKLLAKHKLPATFFVVGRNAAAHPELIAMILQQGHTIGNHSYSHDNFLMLRSSRSLEEEIGATQRVLEKSGIRPLLFRPPVGITNSRLGRVLAGLGLQAVTFSCRVYDRGNRDIQHLAARVLKSLRPGDILLLHDTAPSDEGTAVYWHNELDCLLSALAGLYRVVPLAELIERPVMIFREPENELRR